MLEGVQERIAENIAALQKLVLGFSSRYAHPASSSVIFRAYQQYQ